MSTATKIEWTRSDDGTAGATWNPVTGCAKVSAGCDNCYAQTFAERWRGIPHHPFEQGFDLRLWPERLDMPLKWRRPRRVFVNSMSDLFHPGVPDEFVAEVFAVMLLASGHTFQLLTKRPGRMASLLASATFVRLVGQAAATRAGSGTEATVALPLPNVWLGTSIETQHWAGVRMPDEVTAVAVPSVDQESARDLVRAREDCRGDLMRARHRLSKLLLRQGIVYAGGRAWTGVHDTWLRQQRFDQPAVQMTFESGYEAVLMVKARRDRLDAAITAMAGASEFSPVVHRLGCLRGVGTLTGFALAVEIGDWDRFTGNTIGSFVGLVPCEHSSGASRAQGSITKTGNTHVRRLLVEAAWHHRARYVAGKTMRDRWELAGPAARARGDAGNRRLHARWVRFLERRKRPVIADVAVARELAGWCWSLAVLQE